VIIIREDIFSKFKISCLSLTLDNIPISELGKFSFKNVKEALSKIKKEKDILECVIVQKCNCVEIYTVAKPSIDVNKKIIEFWEKNAISFDPKHSDKISTIKGKDVFKHLLEVSCGLRSLLIGDAQVLGQIRDARKKATEVGTIGPILSSLFDHARITDKRVRNETNFHRGYTSIERTVSEILNNEFKNKNAKIAIVGTGIMGSLVAKSLNEKKFVDITICNRTYAVAKKLADKYNFKLELFKNHIEFLNTMDAVIYTTSSPKYLVNREDLSMIKKRYTPVMIIDIGNPPNVDPTISMFKNITLINLDSIKRYGKSVLENRLKETPKVEKIIDEELQVVLDKIEKTLMDRKVAINLQNFSLNLKDEKRKSVFILKDHILRYIREFLFSKDFVEIQTPSIIVVPTDPVKDPNAELFCVNWYGKKMFLRQSVQLHKQILVISGLDRLFEIGLFWRKEKRKTKRHLSESLGLDVEMANINSHEDVMYLLEELIVFVIDKLISEDQMLLKLLNLKLQVPDRPFYRITYDDAIKILQNHGVEVNYNEDIGVEREAKLWELINKNYKKADFFFIEKYPDTVKKFYVKPAEEPSLTRSFDLIFKGWEIASGAQRETDINNLIVRMKKANLNIKKYNFYLSMFKDRKVPPHGGFGMGLDRLVAKLLDMDDVRDVVLFPRTEENFAP